ncbi:hypothetical protein IE81DRAFT_347693 [Ceraceosorus guamensis]|uniref:VPS9 domain-containing protein n=1 Tax=Ceraceosorus guamensis TaxID=1522189 RepID=A0A316W087_9BASI|nr:hypothetical protein IE81DRAFT_347693 [Ceraceosorus guamensis]PWN42123.1 hypothetical protein IE81DRAFT_347693 [Ceraceosorus guamensis]
MDQSTTEHSAELNIPTVSGADDVSRSDAAQIPEDAAQVESQHTVESLGLSTARESSTKKRGGGDDGEDVATPEVPKPEVAISQEATHQLEQASDAPDSREAITQSNRSAATGASANTPGLSETGTGEQGAHESSQEAAKPPVHAASKTSLVEDVTTETAGVQSQNAPQPPNALGKEASQPSTEHVAHENKQAPGSENETSTRPTISVPEPNISNTIAVQDQSDEVVALHGRSPGSRAADAGTSSEPSGPSIGKSAAVLSPPSLTAPATPQMASSASAPNTPRTPGSAGIRVGKGPPPTTQASEERPFDFNRFLEQMRTKSAQPVGEYVKSFIKGFSKKPYRVTDQQKLIFDFLDFISGIMKQVAPFSTLSQHEFENAMEAMEKLIMNRLYSFTFSPAIARDGRWKVQTDDLERDRVFRQRVRLFEWIREEHLDVPRGEHSQSFVDFAKHELLKINHYKAPRDKLICVLNSCKVIFGLIRHLSSQESADTFIPCLIFVVLKANPDHLISNVEYIGRFRNPDRLSSESGYYLSSLMGAIAFIETMDYTSLSNISQEEFEAKVEAAIQDLAKLPPDTPPPRSSFEGQPAAHESGASVTDTINLGGPVGAAESETAKALPAPPLALSLADDTKAFFQRTGEVARAGLGASLGRPMGALGRLLSDGIDGVRTPQSGAASGPNSGRASPFTQAGSESPGNLSTERAQASSLGAGAGRRLFAGLFGGETNDREEGSAGNVTAGTSTRPLSGLGSASWTRAFRGPEADEEPGTPIREGRAGEAFGFSGRTSSGTASGGNVIRAGTGAEDLTDESIAGRTGRAHAPGAPTRSGMVDLIGAAEGRRPPIQRQGSVDPYSMPDEDLGDGVRTPTDDGSEDEQSGIPASAATRTTRGTRGGDFRPSFLNEREVVNTPTRRNVGLPDERERDAAASPSDGRGRPVHEGQEDIDVAAQSAEISRIHLAAGVETLKSIFPNAETRVVEMVLEGCNGDVQASIDRLLEMS